MHHRRTNFLIHLYSIWRSISLRNTLNCLKAFSKMTLPRLSRKKTKTNYHKNVLLPFFSVLWWWIVVTKTAIWLCFYDNSINTTIQPIDEEGFGNTIVLLTPLLVNKISMKQNNCTELRFNAIMNTDDMSRVPIKV